MNARALVLASTLVLAGCVTFSFDRNLKFTPIADGAIESLKPGEAGLEQCLERLGAPLYVWEYKGDGLALAYGFEKEKTWNVTASVPITEWYSASVAYTDDSAKLRGAVLLFDRDLKLEMVRRGFLRALRGELEQRRPAPVELEDEDGEASSGSRPEAAPAPSAPYRP